MRILCEPQHSNDIMGQALAHGQHAESAVELQGSIASHFPCAAALPLLLSLFSRLFLLAVCSLRGSLQGQCIIFCALFPSKSGLVNLFTVKLTMDRHLVAIYEH